MFIVYDVVYDASYTILYVFNHHELRPLKSLERVSNDKSYISHCVLIVSHENYMIYSVHCAAARSVRTCATPPPTHPVTINYIISWAVLRTDHLSYSLKVHWS